MVNFIVSLYFLVVFPHFIEKCTEKTNYRLYFLNSIFICTTIPLFDSQRIDKLLTLLS